MYAIEIKIIHIKRMSNSYLMEFVKILLVDHPLKTINIKNKIKSKVPDLII